MVRLAQALGQRRRGRHQRVPPRLAPGEWPQLEAGSGRRQPAEAV